MLNACMHAGTYERSQGVDGARAPCGDSAVRYGGAPLFLRILRGYPPELWRSYLLNSSRWAPGGDPPLLEPWPRQPGSPTQQQTGSKPASPANRQPVTQGKTRQPGSLTGQIICEDVRPRHLYPATRQQPGSLPAAPGSTRQPGRQCAPGKPAAPGSTALKYNSIIAHLVLIFIQCLAEHHPLLSNTLVCNG